MIDDNNVSAAPLTRFRGDRWRAYDSLPAPARRALQESTLDWCALEARRDYRQLVKQGCTVTEAIAVLLTTYEQAEAAEIEKFDGQHYRKYRCPLPHVKAGASIQRYGRGARA